MAELKVENIELKYGALTVMKGASFSGNRGEIVALLGSSGSGKTTLLRAIAGLEQPSEGAITVGGKVVFDSARKVNLAPEARDIGLVFQSYALWPHMTVAQNIAFGLRIRNVGSAEQGKRVEELLGLLGLSGLGERLPYQLSGGQQQRVAICRALAYTPTSILMDEPLSNLDAKLREDARFWIRKLIIELGLCAVMVTHDQSEALAMADRIVLLKGGAVIQEGTPTDIYATPTSRYAAEFMGTNNVLQCAATCVDGRTVSFRYGGREFKGKLSSQKTPRPGETVSVVVRADKGEVHSCEAPDRLPLNLEASIYLGDKWEYRLAHGELQLRVFGLTKRDPGPVWCAFDPGSTWVFAE